MPKLTIFEKNGKVSKREYDFSGQKNIKESSKANSFSINKLNLIDVGNIDFEKTEEISDDDNGNDELSFKISTIRKFDEYLIESIDEALTSLGAPVKNTVYFQLENSFNLRKNEIPKQIDEFINIIHKIFGLGASHLEIKFMKNLYSKIRVNIELPEHQWSLSKWIIADISFKEYVNSMRENYVAINKNIKLPKKMVSSNW
jgi:hypothetical protein